MVLDEKCQVRHVCDPSLLAFWSWFYERERAFVFMWESVLVQVLYLDGVLSEASYQTTGV